MASSESEFVATSTGYVKHAVRSWEENPWGREPVTECGRWFNSACTDFREVTEHDPLCSRCGLKIGVYK